MPESDRLSRKEGRVAERAIPMDDDLWKAVRTRAVQDDTNASEIVRRAVRVFLDGTVAPLRSTVAPATRRSK